jgi:hypothetical protein
MTARRRTFDRGQMPVRRGVRSREEVVAGKRRMRTYYMHKLSAYYSGWRQRRHVEQFGVEQLRVLTITVLAALKTENEDDFAIELRKSFYLFDEREQVMIVKAAFEDSSELTAPIRQLIRELPRELQVKIINSVGVVERR